MGSGEISRMSEPQGTCRGGDGHMDPAQAFHVDLIRRISETFKFSEGEIPMVS